MPGVRWKGLSPNYRRSSDSPEARKIGNDSPPYANPPDPNLDAPFLFSQFTPRRRITSLSKTNVNAFNIVHLQHNSEHMPPCTVSTFEAAATVGVLTWPAWCFWSMTTR